MEQDNHLERAKGKRLQRRGSSKEHNMSLQYVGHRFINVSVHKTRVSESWGLQQKEMREVTRNYWSISH